MRRLVDEPMRTWLLTVAVIVMTAVITWYRVPGVHRDRVWAEDANIFLQEGLDHGPWSVIVQGYAGYQHLVPRLVIALLWPFLHLASYPVVVFAICSVLTGLVAGAVFVLSRQVVEWMPARVALALLTALMPLATQETVGNLADLHTYAMWLAPWLLLFTPRRWWSAGLWAVVALLTVMTEIQAVFFFFLIFFKLRRRDRRALPVAGAFLVGAAVQIATTVGAHRTTGEGPLSIPSTLIGWLVNTVTPLVTADPTQIRLWLFHHGLLVPIVILVPIVVAAAVALWLGSRTQRLAVVALLLGSAAIYTGSAWANSAPPFMYAEAGLENITTLVVNIRYGVASGMMLVAVVPIAADALLTRFASARPVLTRVVAWVAVVALIGVLANGSTHTVSARGNVPQWSPAVDAAVAQCRSDDADTLVKLPVAPDRSIELSCADILRFS